MRNTKKWRKNKMPYIRRARRIPLDPHIEALAKEIDNEGEINYCFYKLLTIL
jgi:hypothetical protein